MQRRCRCPPRTPRQDRRRLRPPQHALRRPHLPRTDLRPRLHQETPRPPLLQGLHPRAGAHGLPLLARRVAPRTTRQGEGRRTERPPAAALLLFGRPVLQPRYGRLHPRSLHQRLLPRPAPGRVPQRCRQDGRPSHARHGAQPAVAPVPLPLYRCRRHRQLERPRRQATPPHRQRHPAVHPPLLQPHGRGGPRRPLRPSRPAHSQTADLPAEKQCQLHTLAHPPAGRVYLQQGALRHHPLHGQPHHGFPHPRSLHLADAPQERATTGPPPGPCAALRDPRRAHLRPRSALDDYRPRAFVQRLRNHAHHGLAGYGALAGGLPPLPHRPHLRLPALRLLPPGKPHQPDGPPDRPPHARAQLAAAVSPCQRHHDGLRPALADLHLRRHGPAVACPPRAAAAAQPTLPLPRAHHPRAGHLHRCHLGQHLVGHLLVVGS